MLSVISQGAALAMEATTEPRPTVTRSMGSAQHVSVADVVSRSIQLHDFGLTFIRSPLKRIAECQVKFIASRRSRSINAFIGQQLKLCPDHKAGTVINEYRPGLHTVPS